MRRVYEYLFVKKDPVLLAMPHRKTIAYAMLAVGTLHVVIGLVVVLR